jgi:hypothetical protein
VTVQRALDQRRTQADARLGLSLAATCAAAFAFLVVVPYLLGDVPLPSVVGVVWVLGAGFAVFLGPVVAGLCGYASFMALWSHGDALPERSRRLHLLTLLLAAALLVGLVSPGGLDAVAWWLD